MGCSANHEEASARIPVQQRRALELKEEDLDI